MEKLTNRQIRMLQGMATDSTTFYFVSASEILDARLLEKAGYVSSWKLWVYSAPLWKITPKGKEFVKEYIGDE
jgi:hypothetical protein